MQCRLKQNFVFVNTNFVSAAPALSLIPSVLPSPNTYKLFFKLSALDDELLSTPNIVTFLVKSLPKLHESSPSNAILLPLYVNLLFIAFIY